MGKLVTIDGKTTNWEGLWWHPEYNGFSSAVISLSEIRKFKGNIRLYIRKNKYFNNGENGRPNYCFCIKDANSPVFHILEIEEETATNDEQIVRCKDCIVGKSPGTETCQMRHILGDEGFCSKGTTEEVKVEVEE